MRQWFRPITITIVDFMGVFLPGLVWVILLVTATSIGFEIFNGPNQELSPINILIYLLEYPIENKLPYFFVLAVGGVLIGIGLKRRACELAEYISHPLTTAKLSWFKVKSFWYRVRRELNKVTKTQEFINSMQEKLFSYRNRHGSKDYYLEITRLVEQRLGPDFLLLSKHQPFSTCKRILREMDSPLWEECENLEAEVRNVALLVLATFFSLICSCIQVVILISKSETLVNALGWVIISLFLTLFFAWAYRKVHDSEVEYAYMNVLIAMNASRPRTRALKAKYNNPTRSKDVDS